MMTLAQGRVLNAAQIQEKECESLNKRPHEGEPRIAPLFSIEDAEHTLPLFQPVPYYEPKQLSAGLTCRYYDAGHILGSATVMFESDSRLLFSGDVGRPNMPIIRNPDPPPATDYLIMESTYGGRL